MAACPAQAAAGGKTRTAAQRGRGGSAPHPHHPYGDPAALLAALDLQGKAYQANKYAPNTKHTIGVAKGAFLTYCEITGDWPDPKTGISDAQLIRLITFWGRTLSVATIRNYLSMGVRVWHLENGIPFETAQDRLPVDAALTGLRREKGDTPTHRKLPITIELLRKMRAQLDMNTQLHRVFWAAATTAFFCMLRKGNITATSKKAGAAGGTDRQAARRQDLNTSEDGGAYLLTLNATKTIQFQERALELCLPTLPDEELCPTRAMHAYLASRGPMRPDELLMQVQEPASTAGGEPHWGPLTYTTFLALTKATIRKAGVDPDKYAGHSYRRGGATWAMAIGIPIPAIKAIGDWKSEAYLLYCEVTAQTRRAAAQQMAQALRKP